MAQDRIMIPALDFLLDNPDFLSPKKGQSYPHTSSWQVSNIYIPEEYLVCLTHGAQHYPRNSYNMVVQKLIEFSKYLGGYIYLANGVLVELIAACSPEEEVEQTEAIYLPFKLYNRVRYRASYGNDPIVFTSSHEVQLLAAYHKVDCHYFEPSRGALSILPPSDFDTERLAQRWLKAAYINWRHESVIQWLENGGNLPISDQGYDLVEEQFGCRSYASLDVPGKSKPILVRYYAEDEARGLPERLQALQHNLPDKLLEKLPGAQWQKALSDAILLPPEDTRVVICEGPSYTGKTLTALATLTGAMSASRDWKPPANICYKIVFPYQLFQPSDYLEGYEWKYGMPISHATCERGWDHELDRRMPAFANSLTDAWQELNRLRSGGGSFLEFVTQRCEFCRLEDLVCRRISNAYVFLDNFQNYTVSEARQLLGVAGHNSKLIILGDVERVTRAGCTTDDNGLSYVMTELVAKHSQVAYVRLLPENRPLGVTPLL